MIKCMIAAPHSGSGKTVITTALLAALKQRGLDPCAFKTGPDYIDPMFHRAVLGIPSHNLDLFLSEEKTAVSLFQEYSSAHGAAVVEGVMGYYDGLGGTTDIASSYHVADLLHLPVLLVLTPKGASLTLAAQIQGLLQFRKDSHIVGILLNACSEMLYQSLKVMLQEQTGIPVLGFLPKIPEAEFPSRHLGLYTAEELSDWEQRISILAKNIEEHVDMEALIRMCSVDSPAPLPKENAQISSAPEPTVKLAVARDEAFCFTYAESLAAFEKQGAQLVYFSPLRDECLPEGISALYLPGGYPELYVRELSENQCLRKEIRERITQGLPTIAECGGFLYLSRNLENDAGESYPMVGLLPGTGRPAGQLVRFGYSNLISKHDNLLFEMGESIPVHEFHHWDTDANGEDFLMEKPLRKKSYYCGYGTESLFAAFPHLYLAGKEKAVQRFIKAARKYQNQGEGNE